MKLAIISDTHRLLRPNLLPYLEKVDMVLHSGDIGSIKILSELKEIVPTLAIKGNIDTKPWGKTLPDTVEKTIEGITIKMIHDPASIPESWFSDGTGIIVYGHTHKPLATEKNGVLMLNPGSVGPRRFNLPISFAILEINEKSFSYEFVELEDVASPRIPE